MHCQTYLYLLVATPQYFIINASKVIIIVSRIDVINEMGVFFCKEKLSDLCLVQVFRIKDQRISQVGGDLRVYDWRLERAAVDPALVCFLRAEEGHY